MSPVGAISMPFPLKTGTNVLHPRPPPPIVERVGCTGLWAAGYWLARRLHQLKASTTMDLGISFFLISVRFVALTNLEFLIETDWSEMCPLCC